MHMRERSHIQVIKIEIAMDIYIYNGTCDSTQAVGCRVEGRGFEPCCGLLFFLYGRVMPKFPCLPVMAHFLHVNGHKMNGCDSEHAWSVKMNRLSIIDYAVIMVVETPCMTGGHLVHSCQPPWTDQRFDQF